MRISLILALVFSITLSCRYKKDLGNKDFKFISCEMNQSYGGAYGAGSSRIYTIILESKRKIELETDSGYYNGKRDVLLIVLDSFKTSQTKTLKKREKIELQVTLRDEVLGGNNNYESTLEGSPDGKLEGLAKNNLGITYKGGKINILIINQITEKSPFYSE